MKILKKKLLCLLFCFVLMIALVPHGVRAMTREEALARQAELQQQLIDINKQLAEIQDEVAKAKAKAETYAQRKAIIEEQIQLMTQTIAQTEAELAQLQQDLDQKIREREETFELFKQRVNALYMTNEATYLSVLLGASTFGEFLAGAEYMRQIAQHDNELIDKLISEEAEIATMKDDVEEKLVQLGDEKQDLETKYNELAILKQEADEALSVAQAQEEVTKEEREAILASRAEHEAEFGALMGTGMIDYVGGYYAWPVPGYSWISSGFGWRTLYGVPNYHTGFDIAGGNIYGKPVIASNTGRVVRVRYATTGYGYHVMIDHGGNNWTVYAHLSAITVVEGQWVGQGETIGYVGSTGNSTGPHLHFEIRLNGVQVDPSTQTRYGT